MRFTRVGDPSTCREESRLLHGIVKQGRSSSGDREHPVMLLPLGKAIAQSHKRQSKAGRVPVRVVFQLRCLKGYLHGTSR